ncbi:hypothetical protein FACS1894181_16430 [Bacteroidia bacterium]|nr:hypothetical protein FACS1894181_16430 [Bacteroidia bacterium]
MNLNVFLNKSCAALAAFFLYAACSEENGAEPPGGTPVLEPGEQVLYTFRQDYSEASAVKWSIKKDYYVADFEMSANSYTSAHKFRVWFTKEGTLMVEKMYIPFAQLGEAVYESFLKTSYASWDVNPTAYLLMRRGLVQISGISVTKNGKVSNLYFTMEGDFIRASDDFREYSDAPVTIPQQLVNNLNAMYDKPSLVDIAVVDLVNSEISVGVLAGGHFITAVFFNNYDWIVSFWNLSLDEMPPAVAEGFKKSSYAGYPLLSSRAMEVKAGVSYLFYVNRDGKTVIAEFNRNGQLTAELSRSQHITKFLLTR